MKLVFNTPGHECSHADRGACPQCHNPLAPQRSVKRDKPQPIWRALTSSTATKRRPRGRRRQTARTPR